MIALAELVRAAQTESCPRRANHDLGQGITRRPLAGNGIRLRRNPAGQRRGVEMRQPRSGTLARSDKRPPSPLTEHRCMRQLTSLDAQFLALENARTQGHVSVLGIYDPTPTPCPAGRWMRHWFVNL